MARKKKSSKDTETEVDQETADKTDENAADELNKAETEVPALPDETPATEAPDDEKVDEKVSVTEDPPAEPVEADEPLDNAETREDDSRVEDETRAPDEATVSAETVEQVNILENPPAAPPEPVIIRQGGFIPMVLGGIVAAAIGFVLSQFIMPQAGSDDALLADVESKLEGQSSAVSALNERIDALGGGSDLSAVEAAQSETQSAISELADQLAALDSRLAEVEGRPAGDGIQDEALADYGQQLKELQAAVNAMSENAAQMEENAQSAAQATLQRAALTRVQTALDAGVGFEAAIADLENLGVSVPSALQQSAAGGVRSLSNLQASFPEAARAALSVSRDVADGSDDGGLTSFLRTQLGARSLQPREGNDPDAVLSRAEAAAQQGRLNDALAEIELLPQEGRAQLSEWSDQANQRLEAVAAARELGEKLN